MKRSLSLSLAILAVIATSAAADKQLPREDARKDLAALQGTWNLVAMEAEGDPVPPEDFKGWHAVYEGDALSLWSETEVRRRGIVTLDPSRQPRAINTWDLDGPYEDETVKGIYQLNGDSLKLCFSRPGQARPEDFTTKKGTGFLLVEYRRQKP
jgi:uncharacterized protein (TIGR03067 family)